jgi:hypothetical protein
MLEKPEDEPWAEVFLFYSAIHLIQSYAHDRTPDDIPYNHEGRRSYVVDYMPDEVVYSYYRLDDVSMAVRYKLRRLTRTQIRAIHDDHFAKIRRYLREQGIAWERRSPSIGESGDA